MNHLIRFWSIFSLIALVTLGLATSQVHADPFRPAKRPAPEAAVMKPAASVNHVTLNPQPLPPRSPVPPWVQQSGQPRFGQWGFYIPRAPQPKSNGSLIAPLSPNRSLFIR